MKKNKIENSYVAKEFISLYYKRRYFELFNVPVQINYGKDLKLLIKTLENYDKYIAKNHKSKLEFLCHYCEKYFHIKEGLPRKAGYTIGIFYIILPSLLIDKQDKCDQKNIQIVQESFKLAYLNRFEERYEKNFPYESNGVFSIIYKAISGIKQSKKIYDKFDLINFFELYFLYVFDFKYIKSKINFEYLFSQKIINSFENWLDSEESKEIIFFMPKRKIKENKNTDIYTKISIMEEFILLHMNQNEKFKFVKWSIESENKSEIFLIKLKEKINQMGLMQKFKELNTWV